MSEALLGAMGGLRVTDPAIKPTACLSSLPLELIGHVALWLHSLTDLAQMQCVDRQCRDGASARAAQLSELLGRFPRLKHILRHAARENLWPRPLDLDAILAQQHAADIGASAVAGVLQEMPHAEQLDPALLLTVEMRYLAEFALWSGSPKHAFNNREYEVRWDKMVGPTYRPRLWTARPEWIDELNRLNNADPEAAIRGWDGLHVRVFVTRGVHTVKVMDATHGEGQDSRFAPWGWQDADGSLETMLWTAQPCPSGGFAYVGSDDNPAEDTCELNFRMSDDGYFQLSLFSNNPVDGPLTDWPNVCGVLNSLWPFTTATEVDAVRGVGWWDNAWTGRVQNHSGEWVSRHTGL